MIMIMTTNRKIFLTLVVSGSVALVLIFFIVYPLLRGIKKSSGELIAIRNDLIEISGQTGSLVQIKKIYEEVEPDFKKIDQFLIDPEVPIDLIRFWEKTAKDSEVSINIYSTVLKKSGNELWNSMGFQITLIGSFSHFLRFFEKVETGPYLVEIQNLNVKRLFAGEVSINLAVEVFTK